MNNAAPKIRRLSEALNIEDLRTLARRRIPNFAFEYVDGGAEDQVTMAANRNSFRQIRLVPRQLRDVSRIDLATQFFGRGVKRPFAICPTGYNGMLTHHGDLKLARAAAKFGIPFIQSTMSTSSIEEIAAEMKGGEHWFQLYVLKDRAISKRLMERAHTAGCTTLVITTDAVILGNRESDRRNFSKPQVPTWRNKIDTALKPRWIFDVLVPHGIPIFGNLTEFLPKSQWSAADGARFISEQMERALNWQRIEELRADWPGKLVIKGLMHPEDVKRAVQAGADGVVVSNHGGRQLDGSATPLDQIAQIKDAVGDSCEIYADSGFRRGSDVAKALSLGARGAFFGRATLYGLGAGGQAGVEAALGMLSNELETCMGQIGCTSIDGLREIEMVRD
ncbi:alpha-hydroxy acid oxidase [Pararhodobacter oceanensis]|uniref:Alpha-hydroxy-acid oxidizing protein n=1 Tax=Pararhodobacter oceanensis TaxID=2172121 RepID=A0A2T8HSN6_9RHOB|nr:alpha-hydroxy acid oxidase [Pararhodobacter oceanensis]PVH28454.1 alpha-hydroxy-acid oxidizing protein [Pararhodobacter oceanensis]